jgi:mono/diheme cytochrome c family protein
MVTSTLAVGLASNATLGFAFAAIGYAASLLMLHLWGYPYDKEKRKSAAPRWAMWLHRGLGYAFATLYVVMMWRMVPRLWSYQVELPARSVAHLLLGFTIGFLLVIKILILRLFRHFEEWMPALGLGILLSTTLLLALSIPTALREHALAHGAPGGDPFGEASKERVARLLPEANLPPGTDLQSLATEDELRAGRVVLVEQCSTCHDLKTVLDRPRPPATWSNLVARMAEKPSLFGNITERDQARVTAYLIAITPDLQQSAKRRRAADITEESPEISGDVAIAPIDAGVSDASAGIPVDASTTPTSGPLDAGIPADAGAPDATVQQKPAIDPKQARATFERKCSGCHEISDVDGNPPKSSAEVRSLVQRMIGNGLKASRHDLDLIAWWLNTHYVQHGGGR